MSAPEAENLFYSAQMLQNTLPWKDRANLFDHSPTSVFSQDSGDPNDSRCLQTRCERVTFTQQARFAAINLLGPQGGMLPPCWHDAYAKRLDNDRKKAKTVT